MLVDIDTTFQQRIAGNEQDSFLNRFQEEWDLCIRSIHLKYQDSQQLQLGHRLRPLLTAWGYCLSFEDPKKINFDRLTKVALSVELLHKASIIADDFIDQDNARHGRPTFHVEYSSYESMIMVVHLLGLSVNTLNKAFKNISIGNGSNFKYLDILSKTICDMSLGALKELNLDGDNIADLRETKEIINLETVSLIKNSFLLGYLANGNQDEIIEEYINSIGKKCGFIFQLLNDAEPFFHQNKNLDYKGNKNFDINKSRKNIVFGYIYNALNYEERRTLNNKELQEESIMQLFNKYSIDQFVMDEVSKIKYDIFIYIEQLAQLSKNKLWINEFQSFIDYLIGYCLERIQ